MIHSFIKNSPLKLVEVADYMGIEASSLSKILKGGTYMSYEDYDKLYDFLETHRGIAPRRNGVTVYPSGASKGAFDVFINNQFTQTWFVFILKHWIISWLRCCIFEVVLCNNFIEGGSFNPNCLATH